MKKIKQCCLENETEIHRHRPSVRPKHHLPDQLGSHQNIRTIPLFYKTASVFQNLKDLHRRKTPD